MNEEIDLLEVMEDALTVFLKDNIEGNKTEIELWNEIDVKEVEDLELLKHLIT